jgi:hypothetical protein
MTSPGLRPLTPKVTRLTVILLALIGFVALEAVSPPTRLEPSPLVGFLDI